MYANTKAGLKAEAKRNSNKSKLLPHSQTHKVHIKLSEESLLLRYYFKSPGILSKRLNIRRNKIIITFIFFYMGVKIGLN